MGLNQWSNEISGEPTARRPINLEDGKFDLNKAVGLEVAVRDLLGITGNSRQLQSGMKEYFSRQFAVEIDEKRGKEIVGQAKDSRVNLSRSNEGLVNFEYRIGDKRVIYNKFPGRPTQVTYYEKVNERWRERKAFKKVDEWEEIPVRDTLMPVRSR